jgi:WD40 repeat protein
VSTDEPAFTIHAIPIDAYSTEVRIPFPPIAADDDVRTMADLLTPVGGLLHAWSPASGNRDAAWVKQQLGGWADRDGPRSSVLLWVGHGESDGIDAWLASFGTAQHKKGTGHNATELADHLDDEWSARRQDAEAWTLVVIEACGAERFVELLAAAVLAKPNPPKCFALLAGGGRGSSFLTTVPDALRAVLQSYEDNDEVIRIDDLVGRLENRLEFGRAIRSGLGRARPLVRPRVFSQGVTAPHDVYAELKEFIAGLPADQRGFFVPKAQGTELGELTWYFEGRGRERREITDWLETNSSGLLAVTGPAGSGKSAVLGNIVVHTNPELRDLLVRTGQVERLASPEQPPDNVFDAVVLLTGLSTSEVVDRLAAEIGLEAFDPGLEPTAKVDALRSAIAGRAVLVDALDEAQDPVAVAGSVLRRLAEVPGCRVVVGTRRSTNEGPDLPEPDDTNLLDALGRISTVTVDLDRTAVTNYVKHRLTAAPLPAGAVDEVARTIGAHNRHFLYARLAVHEILARPELVTRAARSELNGLLAQDHRGLFAAAVRRLSVADDNFGPLLEALAHARGRGLPRADGIWATAAGALGRLPTEADLDELLNAAAPYVMLDGENGQSTYRLAHQTFVEHFHAQPSYAEGHRRIAAALMERGWVDANFYAVRYTTEHLVADADRTPPDAYGLAELVTDPGWLPRAIDMLGVDQTVEVTGAARAVTEGVSRDEGGAIVMWMSTFQPIDVVERTLRRSRIALSREPAQLAGQLHARLKEYPGSTMAELGDAIGRTATAPWLRMVEGSLDWRADLESTYGTAGKVRGLAFGHVGDRPVVAIAVDERVELWDPRTGVPDVAATLEVGHRPTAVAVSVIDGRPVVVTTAGYDGLLELWDARSGERVASTNLGLGHAIGVGRVNDRLVVAGVGFEDRLRFVDAVSLEPVDVTPGLEDRKVRGFGVEDDGALLVLAVEEILNTSARQILLINPADGHEIWRTNPITSDSSSALDVMAGARIGAPFVVAAGIGGRQFWFTEGSANSDLSPYGPRTRAIAVGLVDGRGIVASSPDYDGTALVQLQQIEYDAETGGVMRSQPRSTGTRPSPQDRFASAPIPVELGAQPARDASGRRPLAPDRPEDWPQSVAVTGELNDVPILVTGSVEGAVWVWDQRTLSPTRRATERPVVVAGPFVQLPEYILEQGWDLLHVKPSLELVTSVALGDLPDHGPIVAAACGGSVRLYAIADGERIESPADEARAVTCVALGAVNGRTLLVTGSTGGNVTVWDAAAGTRVAGLAIDFPIEHIRFEPDGRISLRTATYGDYTLELIEP